MSHFPYCSICHISGHRPKIVKLISKYKTISSFLINIVNLETTVWGNSNPVCIKSQMLNSNTVTSSSKTYLRFYKFLVQSCCCIQAYFNFSMTSNYRKKMRILCFSSMFDRLKTNKILFTFSNFYLCGKVRKVY